ncbi:MAG: TetR/AcrR family transcriptional regulator [Acidobacteria bacterium]|nr:TetR/AcrR family transcriptional regulator [Acidobacteriota bacterium]
MSFPPKTDREAILRTALEIVETQGWAALSMRELARKLGLRASSLYHHFPDRNAIEEALGAKAASSLLLALKSSSTGLKGKEKLQALSIAYVEFASHSPALYHLIAAAPSSSDTHPEAKALWNLLLDSVSELTKQTDDTAAVVALWAFLHGYVALEAAGKFGPSGAKGGLDRGLSALLTGLTKKQNIL